MKIVYYAISGVFVYLIMATVAFAECNPQWESCGGGGGGGGGGGLYRVDLITLADDRDGDEFDDNVDLCPDFPSLNQNDSDGDRVGNVCDNCPNIANPYQEDTNGNGTGDACLSGAGADIDGDIISNSVDNCVFISNPDQTDTDGDGTGDACENEITHYMGGSSPYYRDGLALAVYGKGDTDGDFVPDPIDNCIYVFNPLNINSSGDGGKGDACR